MVENLPANAGDLRDAGSIPGLGRTRGEGRGNPLLYSCLKSPIDRGAWCAAVHGVAKSRIRLSDFTFTYHFQALEKEMATHSSVPAWKIPWTEEPGRLQSMESQSPTGLSDFTFTFHFHALQKEMATHSSVPAWRIPGTKEPDGLLSMGSHRVDRKSVV